MKRIVSLSIKFFGLLITQAPSKIEIAKEMATLRSGLHFIDFKVKFKRT